VKRGVGVTPGRRSFRKLLQRWSPGRWLRTARRGWARRSARNVRVPPGEADIVCRGPDGRTIVLVEVKSRLRLPGQPLLSATVAPEASITRAKLRRMLATARWLAKVNRWGRRPVRLDVVAIEFERDERTGKLSASWRHHEGVARL
jgi:Holliday junction resolvase-like predicted endonuclease